MDNRTLAEQIAAQRWVRDASYWMEICLVGQAVSAVPPRSGRKRRVMELTEDLHALGIGVSASTLERMTRTYTLIPVEQRELLPGTVALFIAEHAQDLAQAEEWCHLYADAGNFAALREAVETATGKDTGEDVAIVTTAKAIRQAATALPPEVRKAPVDRLTPEQIALAKSVVDQHLNGEAE